MITKGIIPALLLVASLLTFSSVFAQNYVLAVADINDATDYKEMVRIDKSDRPVLTTNAQFPGGELEMANYLKRSINYPALAEQYGIEGKVLVRASLSKTGEILDVDIVEGLFPVCDQEALRAIRNMPNWTPAKSAEESIPTKILIGVKFALNR